jgi:hypothetical protein
MTPRWATGVAEVIDQTAGTITVHCPHCNHQHTHGRGMLGSHSIVAGCHAGPTRLREYRPLNLGTKPRGKRP